MALNLTEPSAAQSNQSDLTVAMHVVTDNLGRKINFGVCLNVHVRNNETAVYMAKFLSI